MGWMGMGWDRDGMGLGWRCDGMEGPLLIHLILPSANIMPLLMALFMPLPPPAMPLPLMPPPLMPPPLMPALLSVPVDPSGSGAQGPSCD